MRKKTKRLCRVISGVLAFVMTATSIPLNTFAATIGGAVSGDASTGESITGHNSYSWFDGPVGFEIGLTNYYGSSSSAETFDVTTTSGQNTMVKDVEAFYKKNISHSSSSIYIVDYNGRTKTSGGNTYTAYVDSSVSGIRTYGKPGTILETDINIQASSTSNCSNNLNFIGEDIWNNYWNASTKKKFTWDSFKGTYLNNATYRTNARNTLKSLFANGSRIGKAINTFTCYYEGSDTTKATKHSAYYLGLVLMIYLAADSTTRSDWTTPVADYIKATYDTSSQKSFKPLLVTVNSMLLMNVSRNGSGNPIDKVWLTAGQYFSEMTGRPETYLYDGTIASKLSNYPSTEDILSAYHSYCKTLGSNKCCSDSFGSYGVAFAHCSYTGHWMSCGSSTFGTTRYDKMGVWFASALNSNLGGSAIFGVTGQLPQEPIVAISELPGRQDISTDKTSYELTEKEQEIPITLTLDLKQLSAENKDKPELGYYSSWNDYINILKKKYSVTDIQLTITPTIKYSATGGVTLKDQTLTVDSSSKFGDFAPLGRESSKIKWSKFKKYMNPSAEDTLGISFPFKAVNDSTYTLKSTVVVKFYDKSGNVISTITLADDDGIAKFNTGAGSKEVEKEEPTDPFIISAVTTMDDAYSEIKEGYIYNETYNAMQGVPTTENLYCALGGHEFVVQITMQWFKEDDYYRKYSLANTRVQCDHAIIACGTCKNNHSKADCNCSGEPKRINTGTAKNPNWEDNPNYPTCLGNHNYRFAGLSACDDGVGCAECCPHDLHMACNKHYLATQASWLQQAKNAHYMKILDCKVWQLKGGLLEGMEEVTGDDIITAEIVEGNTSALFFQAGANTAASGRFIIEGYGYPHNDSAVVWIESSTSCENFAKENRDKLMEQLDREIRMTCVSDYLILRTTNGDQAIFYYDYKSPQYDMASKVEVGSINKGKSTTTATLKVTTPVIGFADRNEQELVYGNRMCYWGSYMIESSITHGGYNGNFMSTDTKYDSTGSIYNIDLNRTVIGKFNEDIETEPFYPITDEPDDELRIVAKDLDIIDTTPNGVYSTGPSYAFYELIINRGGETPMYDTSYNSTFKAKGALVNATYSKRHSKVNDILIHDPVSTINAAILALDESRDQRTESYKEVQGSMIDTTSVCPGLAHSCEYAYLDCTYDGGACHTDSCYELVTYSGCSHTHTPECYKEYSSDHVSGVYNTHVHTSSCSKTTTVDKSSPTSYHTSSVKNAHIHSYSWPKENGKYYAANIRVHCGCGWKSVDTTAGRITEWGTKVSAQTPNRHNCIDSYCYNTKTTYTCSGTWNKHVCNSNCYTTAATCQLHTCNQACYGKYVHLSCTEPHHAFSSNKNLYTIYLMHESGVACKGTACTDTTPIYMPGLNEYVALSELTRIVRHNSGDVHITASTGICSYCGNEYTEVLGTATNNSQEATILTTASHYEEGNEVCYSACNDDSNHSNNPIQVTTPSGDVATIGEFINVDYGFVINWTNTGDFYGDGALASSVVKKAAGAGFIDNMDTTKWIQEKLVKFDFDVNYDGKSYIAGTWISLEVAKESYYFYCPLSARELDDAQIEYRVYAINNPGYTEASLDYKAYLDNDVPLNRERGDVTFAAAHSGVKYATIDVVGRIGALTIEDTGDYRYSNLFKKSLPTWRITNLIHNVDISVQNEIVADPYDIRGVYFSNAPNGTKLDTYGVRNERETSTPQILPLTPYLNNITALQKQPVRVGYKIYADLMTIGNYYGENFYGTGLEGNEIYTNNKVQITPYYYFLDYDTGYWTPVDVYMSIGGSYFAINEFGNTDEAEYPYFMTIDWASEAARRNYDSTEQTISENVSEVFGFTIPDLNGTYTFGTAQRYFLKADNRTFLGTSFTNEQDNSLPNTIDDTTYENMLDEITFQSQAQRWHFTLGLPSSAVFVPKGQECTTANINALKERTGVIVCSLEIIAAGDVWNLKYDGTEANQPFQLTPDSPTYDPINGPIDPEYADDDEVGVPGSNPIVAVFSADYSAKDDLTTVGTH